MTEPQAPQYYADWRYNSNTFGLHSNDTVYTVTQDSGIFPETHDNCMVYNIGRTAVYAKLKYGTKVMWHGICDEGEVLPGEKRVFDNGRRPYYVTGLKVYNNSNSRAVFHSATEDDKYFLFADREPGSFDQVRNQLIKQVFVLGLKYVPYVGSGLSGLVNAFWPKSGPSVWEQVEDKVKALVDQKILQTINGILTGDLRYYQERISVLSQEIEGGGNPEELRVHYMNIAQDMIGFENKFKFGKETPDYQNVNQYILPLFSTFILMKISFYIIGIRDPTPIGLNAENIKNITSYADSAIYGANGANNYINALYKDRVDNAYNTILAEDLYDNMMNARSYIGTQGLEYTRIWNHMLENPANAHDDVYNDVISYSTFFGRQTPNLINEAIPTDLYQPLTPALIDGKRNKIEKLDFYIWRINNGQGAPRIGGMKVYYQNGDDYIFGTESSEVEKVNFEEALLTKLEAYGVGAIDSLVLYFSDDRKFTVGSTNAQNHAVFELENHHIVSIFLSSDNYSLGGQAANISVAYRLNDKARPANA